MFPGQQHICVWQRGAIWERLLKVFDCLKLQPHNTITIQWHLSYRQKGLALRLCVGWTSYSCFHIMKKNENDFRNKALILRHVSVISILCVFNGGGKTCSNYIVCCPTVQPWYRYPLHPFWNLEWFSDIKINNWFCLLPATASWNHCAFAPANSTRKLEAAPNTTNALAACGESGNNAAAKACGLYLLLIFLFGTLVSSDYTILILLDFVCFFLFDGRLLEFSFEMPCCCHHLFCCGSCICFPFPHWNQGSAGMLECSPLSVSKLNWARKCSIKFGLIIKID